MHASATAIVLGAVHRSAVTEKARMPGGYSGWKLLANQNHQLGHSAAILTRSFHAPLQRSDQKLPGPLMVTCREQYASITSLRDSQFALLDQA